MSIQRLKSLKNLSTASSAGVGASSIEGGGMDYAALVNEQANSIVDESIKASAGVRKGLMSSKFNQERIRRAANSMFQKRV